MLHIHWSACIHVHVDLLSHHVVFDVYILVNLTLEASQPFFTIQFHADAFESPDHPKTNEFKPKCSPINENARCIFSSDKKPSHPKKVTSRTVWSDQHSS